jgi:hypothetical protein
MAGHVSLKLFDISGSFRQNTALPRGIELHPRGGDCFVALRAPRNDNICRLMTISAVIASEAKQSRRLR